MARGGFSDFILAFNQGFDTVNKVGKDIAIAKLSKEQETPVYTEGQGQELEAIANAKDENGQLYYTMEATPDGKYTVNPNFKGTDGASASPATIAASGVSYLGKTYDKPLTDTGRSAAKQLAMAGVMDQFGDAEGGMRFRQQAKQGELTDLQIAAAKRTGAREDLADADNQRLRAVMTGVGAANGAPPVRQGSNVAANDSQSAGGSQTQADLHSYLNNMAPEVVKTLLSQGKIDEAKRYSDFVESEAGKGYATAWVTGLRKHAMGDHAGAIKSFEKLYNSQMFNDGQTVKIEPLDGGKQYQVQMFGADGRNIGSQTLDPATLAQQASLLLEPTRAVEFHAQQAGKREAENSTLGRQIQLEKLRQEGADAREDHRDDRLAMRLQAQAERPAHGGLTATQQRSNLEIDAAREQIANLSPAEIRKRTAKQTDTGRENPDYDPSLSRAASLPGRRKVGDDPAFDNRSSAAQQSQTSQGIDRQDVAKRFRSDMSMNSHRLGKDTPNGVEVLDKSGKVIGHYR
jgi:hypothetical protein